MPPAIINMNWITYYRTLRFIKKHDRFGVATIQRQFGVGYAEANAIMSKLEENRIVEYKDNRWQKCKNSRQTCIGYTIDDRQSVVESFVEVTGKFENMFKQGPYKSAETWLNIAYKLDYISLSLKEEIDSLLTKKREIEKFNVKHKIREKDILTILDIEEMVRNTRFHAVQLKCIN